ncbi:AAA family ATPase [Streptomyces sp. NPDC056549]|uniref:AAA family ATPase n=1 Tax=Streptomyces sp. NPDC056549 TaxID=3345864 RepID=UPI0036A60146
MVAGVGRFPDTTVNQVFTSLPPVAEAVRELASALDRNHVAVDGGALLECDKVEFLERWRRLRTADDLEEPLIVHFAGHGTEAGGGLFLAASGAVSDERFLADSCVSFGELLETARLSGRPVLFLLDVCQAGQSLVQQHLSDLAAHHRQDDLRDVWIIAASAADAPAYGAAFTTATAEVLQQIAEGELDIDTALPFVPVDTFAAAIDRQLDRTDRAAGWTGRRTLVRTADPSVAPQEQPFLTNPDHRAGAGGGALTGPDPRLREFALTCPQGMDPLHFAVRAAGNSDPTLVLFSGRLTQLNNLQRWIDNHEGAQGALLAVTGSPGSGKSALLGLVACLLHPEIEPYLGRHVAAAVGHFAPARTETVLAVHARELTLHQVTTALHDQLTRQRPDLACTRQPSTESLPSGMRVPRDTSGCSAEASTKHLLADLHTAGDVLLVLDALDEAADPAAVAAELILPLARAERPPGGRPGPRIIVGTRPWWNVLSALDAHLQQHPGARLDLDPSSDADRDTLTEDLAGYLRRLLPRSHHAQKQVDALAERLARFSDHGAFLAAALYADLLLAAPDLAPAQPPSTISEVLDLNVAALVRTDPWIRPVLDVLGQARGSGMPLDLVHAAALTHHPSAPDRPVQTLTDTRRALRKTAFYLQTTPDADHRVLYRYFHQALTDDTASRTDPETIHRALLDTVPTEEGGVRDWSRAAPYLQRHAIEHAHQAGPDHLDQLILEPGFTKYARWEIVVDYLGFARSSEAWSLGQFLRGLMSNL